MSQLSRRQRFVCAGCALVLAGVFFRNQLSSALVTRGDEAATLGDVPSAMRAYARSILIDPSNDVGLDRLAFRLATSTHRDDARIAIELVRAPLRQKPDDGPLVADRAFAEVRLDQLSQARDDFARVGVLNHDPRYIFFAQKLQTRIERAQQSRARAAKLARR